MTTGNRPAIGTRPSKGHPREQATGNGNISTLREVLAVAERTWYKWLCRRSQRQRLNWERFEDLLRDFPLPTPRITVQIWGTAV